MSDAAVAEVAQNEIGIYRPQTCHSYVQRAACVGGGDLQMLALGVTSIKEKRTYVRWFSSTLVSVLLKSSYPGLINHLLQKYLSKYPHCYQMHSKREMTELATHHEILNVHHESSHAWLGQKRAIEIQSRSPEAELERGKSRARVLGWGLLLLSLPRAHICHRVLVFYLLREEATSAFVMNKIKQPKLYPRTYHQRGHRMPH